MAVTIDPRPTYFGDRMVVTGTYGASDALINLSSLLASIDFAALTPYDIVSDNRVEDGSAADGSDLAPFISPEFATVAAGGTSIAVNAAGFATTNQGGTFIAIGRRS